MHDTVIKSHKSSNWQPNMWVISFFKILYGKFLRPWNILSWDLLGVSFWSRDFLIGSPKKFCGIWFSPPFSHPCHLKSRVHPWLDLEELGKWGLVYWYNILRQGLYRILDSWKRLEISPAVFQTWKKSGKWRLILGKMVNSLEFFSKLQQVL